MNKVLLDNVVITKFKNGTRITSIKLEKNYIIQILNHYNKFLLEIKKIMQKL